MQAIVIDTPEGIAYAQLAALKQAVRLESMGMKHSSGKSMRKVAAIKMGMRATAKADDVIGALNREMERLVAESTRWACNHQRVQRYVVERTQGDNWKLAVYDGNGTLLSVVAGSTRDGVLQ